MATLTALQALDMTAILDHGDVEIETSAPSETSIRYDFPDSDDYYITTGEGIIEFDNSNVTGIEWHVQSAHFNIAGSTFAGSEEYYDGYYYNANLGELTGMTAEVAWWLRENDTINGSSGNDKLRGYDGNDIVKGNAGNDQVTGQRGNDKLYGGDGNDTLKGGSGSNIVDGGAGIDTTSYDWMTVGAKVNLGVTTAQTIGSDGTKDTIAGVENVVGSDFADTLTGNTGSNALNGGAGADVLSGGAGKDTLTGGSGKDSFRFDKALSATTNLDTITDFKAIDDIIQLDNAVFMKLSKVGALSSGNFKASTTGKAADSNDFILYETDTGKLFYDADGSGKGAAVQFATLVGHPDNVTYKDFSVI